MGGLPQGFTLDAAPGLPDGFKLDDLPDGFKLDAPDNSLLPASNRQEEVPSWNINKDLKEPASNISIFDEMKGINSSLQSNVAGLLAFPAGIVTGVAKKAMGNPQDLDPLMGESIHKISQALDKNNPKPASADKYNEAIGEAINQAIFPAALAHVAAPKPYRKSSTFDAKLKDVVEQVKAETPGGIETVKQHELFDQPEQFRAPMQYEAVTGDWRVDENGMPVKADLSMDVKNAEAPLQRNLWGDQLPQKHPQENPLSLPEAIDQMPDLPWRSGRDQGIDLLNKGPMKASGELEAAVREANPDFGNPPTASGTIDTRFLQKDSPHQKDYMGEGTGFYSAKEGGPATTTLVVEPAKQTAIEKAVGQPMFTKPPTAEEILTEAIPEGKDGRGVNSMEAGGTLTAEKRQSALVRGVSRIVQSAKNLAEHAIRTSVFPVERAFRDMKSNEVVQLGKVMKEEMFNKARLTATQLADLGLSTRQLAAYESMRAMFDGALKIENEARAALGQKPITAHEAYLSSRWQGTFRRAVHDASGKKVWELAANSKRGLQQQTDALLKQFPELKGGTHTDHTVKAHTGTNLNAADMYSAMVDVLGRDDPAIVKIKEWVEEQAANEGRGMLAQEKHFKVKSNVRGFVGDRPSNTFFGKFDPKKEALALFQEQITYAKNAYKWAHMQKAGQELKKVFSNEELAAQQPNNMAYAKDYYRNQIGLSTARAISGLEDAIKMTGISPNAINQGIGGVKGLWITQKLAASAGFMLSNVIQAANMLPHMADIMVKHGGNPLTALPMGLSTGLLMALGHISISKGDTGFYKYMGIMPKEEGLFLARAMKYAEDNSVTARSIYDEAPIASSFSKMGTVSRTLGKTLTAPETLLRSISYMTYVNLLKSSGKFKNDMELFRAAEERVNMSMVDYRQGEKAMLFDKMGTMGNMMNTLQTFPINFYQQWNWAAREAGRGNPLPAATMFVVQAYVAGAMGIPGFADTDKLWNWIKEQLAATNPEMWNKVKDIDIKQIVKNAGGNTALYGGLSEQSGVSFTSRAAAPAGSEMLASPAGPYIDLARQAGNIAQAVVDPSKQKVAQAVLGSTLTGTQGSLEVGPLKDQTSVVNPKTGNRIYQSTRDLGKREGQVERTPEQESIRKWGLRSQKEVVERDAAYSATKKQRDAQTVIKQLPGDIYNAARNGNKQKVRDLARLYTNLTGNPVTAEQIGAEAQKEFTTSSTRALMGATNIEGMKAVKLLKDVLAEQNANKR